MTLGLGIITRNKDIEGLKRLLESVKGTVDNIYITVADKEAASAEVEVLAKEWKADLSHFEWCNDFARARNFNMSRVKDDWYVWADTDDVIVGMDKAKPFLLQLPSTAQFVVCTYNYSFTPTGKVSVKHPKERFIRNNAICTWKGRLHETCVSDGDTNGVRCDEIVWNQIKTSEMHRESSLRNIHIIEQEIQDQIDEKKVDPRTVFNLGMAYSSMAQISDTLEDWGRAMRAFQKYIEISGYDQHAYMAWKYVGICQMKIQRPELALQSFFEALKLQPSYGDAFTMLGSAYEALNDSDKAEKWYKLALVAGEENGYASDLETKLITPLFSLASIYARKGKHEDALQFLKVAKKYVGKNDPNINGMEKEIKKIKKFMDDARKQVGKLEKLAIDKRKEAFDALKPKWKSHPALTAFRRSQKWKTETSGKEVVIFGTGWEEWTPDNAKTGIGGSEEAIIYLSKELKNQGWDVTVFGMHGVEAKEYDGIMYRPWWEWSPEEPTDVFICWRDPNIFETKINAKKKYLWLHDTNPASSLTKKRLDNLNKVIVLSKYHRSLYPNVPDEKIMVSANGILPEQFNQKIERNPHRILYTSAPNRGLGTLLDMWPKIKEKVPDAELHWAYGWNTFDLMQKNNPNAQRFKEEMQMKLRQPGCHELGRIGHEELANLMLSSGVWTYPTEFTEIFCITAVKMQAAGCIPVCTNVAALDEMVQFGTKLNVQDIYVNEEAQNNFVDAVVKACAEPVGREMMMNWALENWTWEKVAKQWSNEFEA